MVCHLTGKSTASLRASHQRRSAPAQKGQSAFIPEGVLILPVGSRESPEKIIDTPSVFNPLLWVVHSEPLAFFFFFFWVGATQHSALICWSINHFLDPHHQTVQEQRSYWPWVWGEYQGGLKRGEYPPDVFPWGIGSSLLLFSPSETSWVTVGHYASSGDFSSLKLSLLTLTPFRLVCSELFILSLWWLVLLFSPLLTQTKPPNPQTHNS